MKTVLYLIPYDGVGGVETAARAIKDGIHDEIFLRKLFLYAKGDSSLGCRTSIFQTFVGVWNVIRVVMSTRPSLLIASLWRCYVVLILVKCLIPSQKSVVFLHFPRGTHLLDKLFSQVAMFVATEIWADSYATLLSRVPSRLIGKARVISFLVYRLNGPNIKSLTASFVFWGRIHKQKGLVSAINLFNQVLSSEPRARFYIIGPDGGDESRVRSHVCALGIENSVVFLGEKSQQEIFEFSHHCAFYLQASELEGMGMSVVEAMQLGLIPVVTPVGEIGNYCVHGKNSILISSDRDVIEEIISILSDEERFNRMRALSMATWQDRPLYLDSFVEACNDICSLEH